MRILLFYSLFAVLAIFVNIAAQEVSLLIYSGPHAIYPAIFCGTASGLIFKYLLDKRYIFHFQSGSASEDLTRFTLYTSTGIITTLLFWCTELAFDLLFGTRTARYAGAILGLSLGYLLKYQLDKRYVFSSRPLVQGTAP